MTRRSAHGRFVKGLGAGTPGTAKPGVGQGDLFINEPGYNHSHQKAPLAANRKL